MNLPRKHPHNNNTIQVIYRPLVQGNAKVQIGPVFHHVYVSTIIDSRTIAVRDDLDELAIDYALQQERWMAEAAIEKHGDVTAYIHPMALLTKTGNDVRRASLYDIDKLRGGDGYHYDKNYQQQQQQQPA